jgi:hypothetical protein
MKIGYLSAVAALALCAASPAMARLQLSISDGASTFTCFDGQLSCDVSGGANNLLTIDQTVGGAFVQITLAQSSFGKTNELQLSSANIINETGAPLTIKLLASDTNFLAPVSFIRDSASLTFNNAVGSGLSTLQFWADPLNTQGANPNNTPGALLETVSGTPITNPDSFSGSNIAAFSASAPFSMTEGASLALIGGGSITGFNQSMETGVPEPETWAMFLIGFAFLGAVGFRRRVKERLASYGANPRRGGLLPKISPSRWARWFWLRSRF